MPSPSLGRAGGVYTENVLGRVAGSLVDVGVEALVCRSVMHDQALTGPEDIARDARIVVDRCQALSDFSIDPVLMSVAGSALLFGIGTEALP